MIMIICATYKKNPSRAVDATERTQFSKSRSNDLEDVTQGQRSTHATHLLKLVIICTKYRKNLSGTVDATEVERPWRYRSTSKIITCDTHSHANDHLYQIWKESIQNCRRYRADTIFKVKAEWPWKYRSRSKVITCDTSSDANDDLCLIWKECKQNCRSFSRWKAKKLKKFYYKLNMRHTL